MIWRLFVCIMAFTSVAKAELFPQNVTTHKQVSQFVAEQLSAIRQSSDVQTKRELAAELSSKCMQIPLTPKTEALRGNCIIAFDSGIDFLEFDVKNCSEYLDNSFVFFNVDPEQTGQRMSYRKDEGPDMGFRLLEALGCKEAARYISK